MRTCQRVRDSQQNWVGTYNKREEYYDTVTKQVSVVTSPSPVDSCAYYFRSPLERIDDYCDGNDRIEVYHNREPAHNETVGVKLVRTIGACAIAGCNISFVSARVEYHESREYGSITFTMSTSEYEYSLTNFNDYLSSVYYTRRIQNIYPGDYILSVRQKEKKTCVATLAFTIDEKIDYNPKWFFELKDRHNNDLRVEILGKNYEGTATDIEYIGSNPIVIDWKGRGNDKFRPIVTSECILTVNSSTDFEYYSLFSSDEKAHRIDVYKNGAIFWRGYVIPDVYTEPYLAPPYLMTVSAVDGLNTLKKYDYENPNETSTYREIITYCLDKIGHGIDFLDSAFILPSDITGTPLNIFSVKNKAFEGLNCYEVLERVVFANLGRLTQLDGSWQMVPITQLKDIYELRDSDSTIGTMDPVIQIGDVRNGEPYFRDRSQTLNIKPAYKEITVIQDYGLDDVFVKNSTFEFIENVLPEWIGELYLKRYYRKDNGDIATMVGILNRPISQEVDISPTEEESRIALDIEYKVAIGQVYEASIIEITFSQGETIDVIIKLEGNYLFFQDSGWDRTTGPGIPGRSNIADAYLYPAVDNAERFRVWLEANTTNYTISRTNNVVKISANITDVKYDFGDVEVLGYAEITDRNNQPITTEGYSVQMVVYAYDSAGNEKTLSTSGHWMVRYSNPRMTGLQPNKVNMPVKSNGEWNTFTLLSDPLPEDTVRFKIELHGYGAKNRDRGSSNNIEAHYKKANISYLPGGDYAPKTSTLKLVNDKELTFIPSDYLLFLGEPPLNDELEPIPNADRVLSNLVYYNSDMITQFTTGEKTGRLLDIIANIILSANMDQIQVISGTMRGDFNLNNTFVDSNNPGKEFIVNYMRLNLRKNEADLELVEMPFDIKITNALLLETGDYFLQEDGGLILLEDG